MEMASDRRIDDDGTSGKGAADEARRDVLKRMGKYAAYTAPTLISLVMVSPARAAPRCSIAGPAGNPSRPSQC
jgi:hypothetical protein